MNPRQRRGILLISLAGIGAVLVFVLVSNYLSDVRSQLGPTVAVLVSTDDLPPLATPEPGSLSTVEIPQRWLPPNALQSADQIAGRIAAATIPANTIISEGMFLERFELDPGQREIAIMVDAETGVGGKVTAGSVVDIFATFAGDDQGTPPSSRIVLQRAEVLAVGSPVDVPEDGGPGPGSVGFGTGQRIPVTFRLSVEDANRLVYVESFATSVRLALRSPLDRDLLTGDERSIFDSIDELGRAFDPVGDAAVQAPATADTPQQPDADAPDPAGGDTDAGAADVEQEADVAADGDAADGDAADGNAADGNEADDADADAGADGADEGGDS